MVKVIITINKENDGGLSMEIGFEPEEPLAKAEKTFALIIADSVAEGLEDDVVKSGGTATVTQDLNARKRFEDLCDEPH
jgi:hypothetical protein